MPNVWEVLQEIASSTHSIRRLEEELREIRLEIEPRIRDLEVAVARLQESQQTVRELVRAEIALAVAELRVRYAESQITITAEPPALEDEAPTQVPSM